MLIFIKVRDYKKKPSGTFNVKKLSLSNSGFCRGGNIFLTHSSDRRRRLFSRNYHLQESFSQETFIKPPFSTSSSSFKHYGSFWRQRLQTGLWDPGCREDASFGSNQSLQLREQNSRVRSSCGRRRECSYISVHGFCSKKTAGESVTPRQTPVSMTTIFLLLCKFHRVKQRQSGRFWKIN